MLLFIVATIAIILSQEAIGTLCLSCHDDDNQFMLHLFVIEENTPCDPEALSTKMTESGPWTECPNSLYAQSFECT